MILFLYTHLHREVTDALEEHAPGARRTYVGAGPRAAWRAVRGAWGSGEDLVLIEQHAVVTSGIMEGFRTCPSPWCPQLAEVVTPGNYNPEALSAVRFSSGLQSQVPVQEIEAGWGSCFSCSGDGSSGLRPSPGGPGCWRHMDGALIGALKSHGFSACTHEPCVFHWKVRRNAGQSCRQSRGEVVA